MYDHGSAPRQARIVSVIFAVAAAADAAALRFAVVQSPLGDLSSSFFFPRLRRALLFYVAALGAVSAFSFCAAVFGQKFLLLVTAVVIGLSAPASIAVAYIVHRSTARFEPFLLEECRKLREYGECDSAAVAFLDMGVRQLEEAFIRCRDGHPEALTLEDCHELADAFDVTGGKDEYFMRLERDLERHLHCGGLCRELRDPLFVVDHRLAAYSTSMPACELPLSKAAAGAGLSLSAWLGLFNTTAFLATSFVIAFTSSAYYSSLFSPRHAYRQVPSLVGETELDSA